MDIREKLEREIIEVFRQQLRGHLFSETSWPRRVDIRTSYAGCVQDISMVFDSSECVKITHKEGEK